MKKTRMRKTAKKDTLGYWKKKFWTEFSRYVRKRDKGICFTCGGVGSQSGHFIPRASGGLSLYFNEQNVWAQCYRCNINLGGNGGEYYRRLVQKLGIEEVEELFKLRDQGYRKYSIEEYQSLIEEYKTKTEELDEIL